MTAIYDVNLVLLSILIAVFASYCALELAGQIVLSQGRVRQLWLAGGATVMGIGIWSMHFTIMLAYKLPIAIVYDLSILLASIAVAIVASGVALFLVSHQRMGKPHLLVGGTIMGLAIASMHYMGMLAMRLEATAEYDPMLVVLSVVIAIAASLTAIWLAFHLRAETTLNGYLRKIGSAIIMGNAVAGMHYTAMVAVSFKPTNQLVEQLSHVIDNSMLGVGIGIATLVILALVLLVSFNQRISTKIAKVEALRESEERFRALVQNSSDIITILEADGTVRYKSPSVEQITGYKPGELVGKNVFNDLHPEDIPEVRAAFAKVIQKPDVLVSIECRFRHANGSWIYLESICNNLLNDANIKGVVVNSRDITERKRLEAIARSREQELSDFLENASIGLHWVGSDGRILWANQAELKLLGYTDEEYIDQHIAKFHADKEVIDDILRRLTANETLLNYEARLLCKDGSIKHVLINSNVFWKDDQFIHTRCFTRDITERKRAEEALQKAHDELEIRVEQRTTELKNANEQLQSEIVERQRAEEALRESQQMLQLVMDNIPQFIFWKDRNSVFLGCNRNLAQLAGLSSPNDIFGKTDYDLPWKKEEADFFRECDRRVMETDIPEYHIIEPLLQADSKQAWLDTSKVPLHDSAGNVVGILGSFEDITERQQVEQALRKSEARNRALLNAIPDLILRISKDGIYLDCKQAKYFDMLVPESELIGKSVSEVLPPALAQQSMHYVERALQTGDTQIFEYQLLRNGKVRDEEARIVVSGEDEVLVIIRDISDRKWAKEALQKSNDELEIRVEQRTTELKNANERLRNEIVERQRAEERLRLLESVVVNANDAILITEAEPIEDIGPRILYVNEAFTRTTGYSLEDVVGKTPRILQGPRTDRAALDKIRAALKAWQPVRVELINYRKDGSEFWEELNIAPVADETGWYTHWISVQREISERKQAEEEILKALEKEKELRGLKSRFISMISHEFRTPLTTILSSMELLEYYGHKSTETEKQDFFQQIRTAIQRMTQLLNDVLATNKAEAGKLEFKPHPLELEKFCHDLVKELQFNTGAKHQISWSSQGQSINACMDEKLLRHIFTNLLSNAIKYSPQGSTIYFEVACQNEAAIFQVKDEGIGIPLEDQKRLFEPFHRAKNVSNIPGTGLGLSIVKRLVELHEGSIMVASQVGVGTTFTVTLSLNNRGINRCTRF